MLLEICAEYMFFYKHMKFQNQARLCLAVSILRLTLCLTFQGAELPVWKKFNSDMAAAKGESLFNDFY